VVFLGTFFTFLRSKTLRYLAYYKIVFMLTYRLPQFFDYLNFHYHTLYERYAGRLIELFPSFQAGDNNLMIVHDAADDPSEDELVIKLWHDFTEAK
jgi:hypothetical protein